MMIKTKIRIAAVSSLLKQIMNQLSSYCVNVEERLIISWTRARFYTISAIPHGVNAFFFLRRPDGRFGISSNHLIGFLLKHGQLGMATAHAIATPTHQTWKPCVRSPLTYPTNHPTIPKIVMIIWYTNSASSCPL